MRPGRYRLSRETHPTGTEELLEVTPEAIDEDAAELEDGLGAIATPPHAGAVEPDTDEVTYRPSMIPLEMSRSCRRKREYSSRAAFLRRCAATSASTSRRYLLPGPVTGSLRALPR